MFPPICRLILFSHFIGIPGRFLDSGELLCNKKQKKKRVCLTRSISTVKKGDLELRFALSGLSSG